MAVVSKKHKMLFVHVMRTGGTSFQHMLWNVLPDGRVYPTQTELAANERRYVELAEFAMINPLVFDDRDVVMGHLPFSARERVPGHSVVVTLLRDPVERSLSQLSRARARNPRLAEKSLLELLGDPRLRDGMIADYQTKYFALRSVDELDSINLPLRLDDGSLEEALSNLERCAVVGVTERFDEFVRAVEIRFGWRFPAVLHNNRAPRAEVESELLGRLEELTRLDRILYERAVALVDSTGAKPG